MEESETIGVDLRRCDIKAAGYYFRKPAVTVHLIDKKKGQHVEKKTDGNPGDQASFVEPVTTKNQNVIKNRYGLLEWEESLILEEKISLVENRSDVIFMFDIFDELQSFRNKSFERIRIAWAFLIPKPSDKSSPFRVGKELRLQLYKPRKSCKISHHTCNIFHLYSDHAWKKLHGILCVTIKGASRDVINAGEPRTGSKTNRTSAEEKTASPLGSVPKERVGPDIKLTERSRLPTQSCKVPNHVFKTLNAGPKGGSHVRFGNAGRHVAVASFSKIFVCDVLSGEPVSEMNGHNGLIYELDWSPDDDFLLSVSADCTAAVWSVSRKTPSTVLPHPSFVYCGKWLGSSEELVTGGKDRVVRRWSKRGDRFELTEEMGGHRGFVTSLAVGGDSVLFSGDSEGSLIVRKRSDESDSWIPVKRFAFDETRRKPIDAIHVHPGGRRVVLTSRGRGPLAVDTVRGVVLQNCKAAANASVRSVSCLTPCGSSVYFFSRNGELNVWEVDTGKSTAVYENLFPVDRSTELGSSIDYHPFEHVLAFTVLGRNHPVYLLSYDGSPENDDSKKLGLTFVKNSRETKSEIRNEVTRHKEPAAISLSGIKPDKLTSIVQKLDQAFNNHTRLA